MSAHRVILHPTDFSSNSTKAFQVAAALARDRGARVLVLHVAPSPLTSLGGTQALPPQAVEFNLQELKDQMAAIRPPEGVTLETRLEVGGAADTILAVARDTGCEMVVMGTHGRSGISRLLMGSVAEMVVRRAPCPVLTLKAEAAPG